MSSRLGPIDIDCDAPAYAIVRACESLGFHSPLDVRWLRRSRLESRDAAPPELFGSGGLNEFFGLGPGAGKACGCGALLPELESCAFQFRDGSQVVYRIGQCPRCRTIYWDGA